MKALTVHVTIKKSNQGLFKNFAPANEFAFASSFPELLSGISISATPPSPRLPSRVLHSPLASFLFGRRVKY